MNKELKSAREEYLNIKAPESLKTDVEKMFKYNNKKIINIVLSTACGFLLVFTIMINTNKTLASNLAKNDLMRPIINVLTAYKYNFTQNNMKLDITIPKIVEINNPELEEKINLEIESIATKLKEDFEKDATNLSQKDKDAHMSVYCKYDIKTNNDKYLSIDIYVGNDVGSSSTIHKFYNINKLTGEIITLADMFDDENYIETICKKIYNEMTIKNKDEEGTPYFSFINYESLLNILSEKEKFYINEDGNVVIVFDKYEIGPGTLGSPEFEIK